MKDANAEIPPARSFARQRCSVVGVGASAGGLEAFSQLLRRLPLDTGFAFVLVQHLDPLHDSALAELLARTTAMPVREVTNNLRVEPNRVYIIPPNRSLGITRGVLKLRPRLNDRYAQRAIDGFFEALARDQGERAIGVILSGNATDGTLGLEAIKAAGGFTFAQDGSARHESMPRSAVAAGCVDLELSPGRIAQELARLAKSSFAGRPGPTSSPDACEVEGSEAPALSEKAGYEKILLLLRNYCGVDFSLYKPATIHRRIARRAVLTRSATLGAYADLLRAKPLELDALYADALISVTSFFRNRDAFEVLRRKVLTPLLRQRDTEPVRVWVLGCSTGQEAYSIAMVYAEAAAKIPRARKLQVFATDLNDANLNKARLGYYAKSLVQDVSPARLRRFFVEEEGGYRIIKSLREAVVFARQNVISDPPFSRMDLVSCRNLMIYLEPSLQKRVMPNFHYALKPGGFLFLGASESIGGFADLFVPVDPKQKIFAKQVVPTQPFHLPLGGKGGRRPAVGKRPSRALSPGKAGGGQVGALRSELNAEREADRISLSRFAPPAVLVNAAWRILQFRGPTGAYLEPPIGQSNFDLLRMARPGLLLPLRSLLARALKEDRTARQDRVAIRQGDRTLLVNLAVFPLKKLKERCFLVVFEEAAKPARPGPTKRRPGATGGEPSRLAGLERELFETRDYLRSVQEQQDGANEELQAANEEGQSANEELQSLNEELETSKEELESTNEELTTMNEEMVSRNAELHRLIADLRQAEEATRTSEERFRALFDLGPVGVYTCDLAGKIREFNRCAAVLWGRKPKVGDAGEKYCGSFKLWRANGGPLPHARCPMAVVLQGEMPQVLDAEVVMERPDGSRITVIANIVPLKDDRGEVTGAINCFYDITERKRADEALRAVQAELKIHTGELEHLVTRRTQELTVANRHLQNSVDSVLKGNQEYRALLAQSEVMQGKLRHVTRRILTAQEEERKQISRELHDEVVQTLIGINVELTNLSEASGLGSGLLKRKLARTQRVVSDSVEAVHRFARGLRPAALDDLGLVPALHSYCRGLATQQKLNIEMTAFAGVEALDGTGRTVLYRVAQEALNNVVRHAHATRITVNIEKLPGAVRMVVRDDGKAFAVKNALQAKNPGRLGLLGMRERIEMVGGSLTIDSERGTGTTVRAEIPFAPGGKTIK